MASRQAGETSKAADRSKRHVICQAQDVEPGHRKIVKIGGREIGVFNVNGSYHALRNI